MNRLPLPPQHRGVTSRLEEFVFKTSGRALLGALVALALAVLSHFRHF